MMHGPSCEGVAKLGIKCNSSSKIEEEPSSPARGEVPERRRGGSGAEEYENCIHLEFRHLWQSPSYSPAPLYLRGGAKMLRIFSFVTPSNVGSSSNALRAPPIALRATMAFESPRALRGCMVLPTNSIFLCTLRLRRTLDKTLIIYYSQIKHIRHIFLLKMLKMHVIWPIGHFAG